MVSGLADPVMLLLPLEIELGTDEMIGCYHFSSPFDVTLTSKQGCQFAGKLGSLALCRCTHLSEFVALFEGTTLSLGY